MCRPIRSLLLESFLTWQACDGLHRFKCMIFYLICRNSFNVLLRYYFPQNGMDGQGDRKPQNIMPGSRGCHTLRNKNGQLHDMLCADGYLSMYTELSPQDMQITS